VKIAYLDCFSGISGDMFLGALVDAGVPFSVLEDAVSSLDLEARLELRRVNRSGIDAAKVDVVTLQGEIAETAHATVSAGVPADGHEHAHSHGDHSHPGDHSHTHGDHEHHHSHDKPHVHGRSLSVIQEIIRSSRLPLEVQANALRAFELLGHAEAKIHNVPVESIHFHEVGAVDAIADIVAVSAGCHWLRVERQVEKWICSPLNVGGGHVHCAHGVFPVPAPATLELLRDLPVYSSGVQKELVTPTGAALLRALAVTSSGFPAMIVSATGYGAGTRDLPGKPNVLRLVVGESTKPEDIQGKNLCKSGERVGVIETTIDDATPELVAYVADRLLAAGASDVYRTPIQMKKGRTGMQLTILCSPAKAEALQKMVFMETTTLGLRYREEQKLVLARSFVSVNTEWGAVKIKIGMLADGEVVNSSPEFEDCRLIAERHAVPLKQVMQAAMTAYLMKEACA
jgi:pyridinium-3,5-bisthiocarboxylic acid mononucleotide nickel chelatase